MSKLIQVTYDLETFWSSDYTLSKLSPLEYVLDDRFELQTCATKIDNDETVVTVGQEETQRFFKTVPWGRAILVGHNASGFDHLVARYRLGLNPKIWADTADMARPWHAKDGPCLLPNGKRATAGQLSALAVRYNLPLKGDIEALDTRGKRLADMTPREIGLLCAYNINDTEITHELFKLLLPKTTAEDMRMIDMIARMVLYPQFELDMSLLRRGLNAERKRKLRSLEKLAEITGESSIEAVRKTCASAKKFGELLTMLGVDVPTKVSKTTGKEIPALAKTDEAMVALLEDPDERVRAAAEARVGVKSTQLETRLQRFITVGELFDGKIPVPLKYAGADTTLRLSGSMALNMQNLPRIGKKRQVSDVLRCSLKAPEGYAVVVADLSAIELRVNHFLWKEPDTMARFRADALADIYKSFAGERLYHVPEDQVTKDQRFSGKVAQLQLGYRSGAAMLKNAARIMSGGSVVISQEEAQHIVNVWRATYSRIVAGWEHLDNVIAAMHDGRLTPIDDWGLCTADKHGIKTPKAYLSYPQIHKTVSDKAGRRSKMVWRYRSTRGMKEIHGGVLAENLSQSLAGQIMRDAMLAYSKTNIGKRYPLAHQVHDEAIAVARLQDAQAVLDQLQECLRKPPTWWPELVVWSEGGYAESYGAVDK